LLKAILRPKLTRAGGLQFFKFTNSTVHLMFSCLNVLKKGEAKNLNRENQPFKSAKLPLKGRTACNLIFKTKPSQVWQSFFRVYFPF